MDFLDSALLYECDVIKYGDQGLGDTKHTCAF